MLLSNGSVQVRILSANSVVAMARALNCPDVSVSPQTKVCIIPYVAECNAAGAAFLRASALST